MDLPPSLRPHAVAPTRLSREFAAHEREAVTEQEAGKLRQSVAAMPRITDPITIGDVLDMDPQEAERAGLAPGATAISAVQGQFSPGRVGGKNKTVASPFSSEYGSQPLDKLRMVPLQRATGAFGINPDQEEKTLSSLYFIREAKRAGFTDITQMKPEEYADFSQRADDMARRDVASKLGTSEARGNMLATTQTTDELVSDIRAGRGLPAPVYLTPFGLPTVYQGMRGAVTGTAPEEDLINNLVAPFNAVMKPGVTSATLEDGRPVAGFSKESKLSWIFRMAPSTSIGSWLMDPELTWDIGGETGWGGKRHIQKIVEGYDVVSEVPKIGEAWDRITPWESSWIEKAVAGVVPVGAVILFEPDAISVGTAAVGAPVAKAVREAKLGIKVVENVYGLALLEWKAMIKAGATLEEVAEAAGPKGSYRRLLYDAVLHDSLTRLVNEASGEVGAVGAHGGKVGPAFDIDAIEAGNASELTAKARDAADEAAKKVAASQAKIAHGRKVVADETEAERLKWVAKTDAYRAAAEATEKEMLRTEDALVSASVLRSAGDPIKAGDFILDTRTGQRLEFLRFEEVPARGGRGTSKRAIATDAAGATVQVPMQSIRRFGRPAVRTDTNRLLTELSEYKRTVAELRKLRDQAAAAGNMKGAARLDAEISRVNSKIILNLKEVEFARATATHAAAYRAHRDAMNELIAQMGTAPATMNATIARAMKATDKAIQEMGQRASHAMAAERQATALENIGKIFDGSLDRYIKAKDEFVTAARTGTMEAGAFKAAVIDSAVTRNGNRFALDGAKYYQDLIAKYGSDAVDSVARSPVASVVQRLGSLNALSADGVQELRNIEKAIHAESEARRLQLMAPAKMVMQTLGEFKGTPLTTLEGFTVRSYQLLDTFRRAGDWVGGTAIGRAPRQVREVIRRSFERFTGTEHDIGKVGAEHGADGIREYLTSARVFKGVWSNQDTLTLADKAVLYLRSIADAAERSAKEGGAAVDVWKQDIVREAIENAPVPSFMAARLAPGLTGSALRHALKDPKFSGADLVKWIEEAAPAVYAQQLGKSDTKSVVFRFMARAVAQAANGYDTMFDLMRTTGTGLGPDAAKALDWFSVPERSAFGVFDIEDAYRAGATFGVPKLSKQLGARASLLTASEESARLVRAAVIQGQDHWISVAAWKALQEVPRRLAKEQAEFFRQEHSALTTTLDRFARLWRVATVNGYVLPRARHFVNTFAGDWSQMVSVLGWRRGTRLAAQSAVSYVPFVGPRLQDALSKAAGNSSVLRALFNPELARVMSGSVDEVIETADGPMSAARFMQEALQDGGRDSISTRDLLDMTSRMGPSRQWYDAPAHIEAAARFMEEIQFRNRVAVYLEARTTMGLDRGAAHELLTRTLFDWKTSVPTVELQSLSRFVTFWTYRRNMFRQLGAALTEGMTNPSAEYFAKAMTGRTAIARTRQIGKMVAGTPDVIYWADNEEYLDDPQQLHALGLRTAPWWVNSEWLFANREVSPDRVLWESEVAGRKVTYESLMLPTLTTMDQLWMLNLFVQTGMASTVALAEKAGIPTKMTTMDGASLANKLIDEFADFMMPGADSALSGALKAVAGVDTHVSDRGVLVPRAQAIALRRLGWEDFMAAHPDADGSIRMDKGAYGVATSLILSFPVAADMARNWAIFDNPGMQESVQVGLLEALSRYTGVFAPQAFDPFQQITYEMDKKERELKAKESELKKQVTPRDSLYKR